MFGPKRLLGRAVGFYVGILGFLGGLGCRVWLQDCRDFRLCGGVRFFRLVGVRRLLQGLGFWGFRRLQGFRGFVDAIRVFEGLWIRCFRVVFRVVISRRFI